MSPLRLNGSTSGNVTLDAPAVSGNNTLVLPTGNGTSGQVLTTNGSGALSWGNAGKILQVVSTTYTTQTSTTSTTYVNSGLQLAITPSSSANKVLALSTFIIGNGSSYWNFVTLFRDSTNLAAALNAGQPQLAGAYNISASDYHVTASINYLDSPATTSAVTYSVRLRSGTGSTVRLITDGIPASLILMEVAA